MGIEPFLLSSSLLGVLSQRLIRMTCPACHGAGCNECAHSGYSGRNGIYELMTINAKVKELIYRRASETEIREEALLSGMHTLAEDGERWISNNKTSREELLRVTGSDEGSK
jgi:general secretion pathway protein E